MLFVCFKYFEIIVSLKSFWNIIIRKWILNVNHVMCLCVGILSSSGLCNACSCLGVKSSLNVCLNILRIYFSFNSFKLVRCRPHYKQSQINVRKKNSKNLHRQDDGRATHQTSTLLMVIILSNFSLGEASVAVGRIYAGKMFKKSHVEKLDKIIEVW